MIKTYLKEYSFIGTKIKGTNYEQITEICK